MKRRKAERILPSDGRTVQREPLFNLTRIEDAFGSLKYEGPAKTIEEMDAAVLEEAKRRFLRSFKKDK